MLKVLIVDDEPIMRKGIFSKIDWEGLRLECVGEAKDGTDALERIRETRPNIVLTDIRMPEMDGLDFISRAKNFDPELRFVVISGYDDFQYAREAIRFGVSDYLLKPVTRDELRNSLLKICDELLAQGNERDFRTVLLKHYEANITALRQRKLTRLLQGSADAAAIADFRVYWDGLSESGYTVAVYRFEPIGFPHIGFSSDEEDLIWYCIQNIVEQSMREMSQGCIVFRHGTLPDELIAIIACSQPGGMAIRQTQHTLGSIRKYLRLDAVVGLGYPVNTAEELAASYEQAVTAARGAVLHGTGKVYPYSFLVSPDHKEQGGTPRITGEQERLLSIHLRERNEAWVWHWLEQRYEELSALPDATYIQFERLSLHIYSLLNNILRELTGDGDAMLPETGNFVSRLLSFRTWRDAVEALMETSRSVMRMISEPKSATGGDIVDEVKRYIGEFFNENITLSWVAEKYYIHPNYFSKLFKVKCGENFNDYVTRIRLEKAVNLMVNSELKLSEIAEMVGYDSAPYFSNVFRKVYGMSPSMYREKLLI
ncbi:response regulator [Cohnella abietis]|uniref:DNA-binding response regulator n=1 Tax=Cohnella abietis TaxID=2507935 RepID=A0A3T1D0H8_9BACL|nr:response regulator [Cohnella abietis]BBI31568.1 hypothetical protein KCTCHS21_09670 [Cohnella abietis]